MIGISALLRQRRLLLSITLFLVLAGIYSWLTMPRQEDPSLKEFIGQIVAPYPGADAEKVERLVLEPLEEHLLEVEGIAKLTSTIRANVAIIVIELETSIDLDAAWDDVREAIRKARQDFPAGVPEPLFNDQVIGNQESVILALTGSDDLILLTDAAEKLKLEFQGLAGIAKVLLVGDPGEQITVTFDQKRARQTGLTPAGLIGQLARRSRVMPAGSLNVKGLNVVLSPTTEFESLTEIAETPIILPSGATIPLSEIAEIQHTPQLPANERLRYNGRSAVGVSLIFRKGIDVVAAGNRIHRRLAELKDSFAPLKIEEVFFQPKRVKARLHGLQNSLLQGIAIVSIVLIVLMGLRLGLLVSAVVPMVLFASIAIFAAGGGILHQISIASLVLALGMLVDNAVVVAENIQWRLDQGESAPKAAANAVAELAKPLAGATGTTLAAFVPMLLAQSTTADFTRSIPIVIMLTLTVSYLAALLITPILAEIFLRRRSKPQNDRLERIAGNLSQLTLKHSKKVLFMAFLLVVLCGFGASKVERQFFPGADRNQFMIDLILPEGSHLKKSDQISRRLETALLKKPEVTAVVAFIGRGAPRFFYNVFPQPNAPHLTQLVVSTRTLAEVKGVMMWARQWLKRTLPEAVSVVKQLEQGPPIKAPVEVHCQGDNLENLRWASDQVMAVMRTLPGTLDVSTSLSRGVPSLDITIDDAAAARNGLNRDSVAKALLRQTYGIPIGYYRARRDPVPIVLRSPAGEDSNINDIAALDVTPDPFFNPAAKCPQPLPLAGIAKLKLNWKPAALEHRRGRREITVSAQLAPGVPFSRVFKPLQKKISKLKFPPGISVTYGGELESSGKANQAMLRVLPWGIMLLLAILLAEFNSFRQLAIIMATVPLAAAGVVPGLLVSHQPFGFMSMLGVIALIGIVVNNAIVLLDVIETRRRAGDSMIAALTTAVARRIRPILLTSITTVVGLLPLAFSHTSLWPPLAWAMISGLLASTLLTLLVVPSIYRLLFSENQASE